MSQTTQSESLDHLLAQVCRLHHARAHDLLEEIGLFRGQPPLLHVLHEQEGLTHGELASRLGVAPPTMTKMIRRMERSGFVQRRPDVRDQRISRVYLTEAGRAIRGEMAALLARLGDETFASLTTDNQAILRRLLAQVRENLEAATYGARRPHL